MLPLTEKPSLYFDQQGYQKIVSDVPKIPGALQMKNWGKFVVFLIDSYLSKPQTQVSDNSAQISDYQKTLATLQQEKNTLTATLSEKDALIAELRTQLTEGAAKSESQNSEALIADIEAAHREVITKLNASHDKQVGELKYALELTESKVQELMEENTNLQSEVDDSQATLKILRQQVEGIAAKKGAIIELSQRYLSRSSFTEELNKIIP